MVCQLLRIFYHRFGQWCIRIGFSVLVRKILFQIDENGSISSSLDSIHFRLPFDWKTPIGYLFAFIVIAILQMNVVFFMLCCLSTGIGIYLFTTSFTQDIENDLTTFSDDVKSKGKQSTKKHFMLLIDFVQFHSKVKRFDLVFSLNNQRMSTSNQACYLLRFLKRLVCNWSENVQPMLLVLFATNIITISVSMLLIQMEMVRLNSIFQVICFT